MQESINKEWMDDYEKNYSLYKEEWDFHYQKVNDFIHSCLPHQVNHWGFIGVTNTIPEIDSRILHRITKVTLLDINDESLKRARIHLASVYDFHNVDVQRFDNTGGFVDTILENLHQLQHKTTTEKKLLDYFKELNFPNNLKLPKSNENNKKYDFITHLGLMDYYCMPIFIKYCPLFQKFDEEFFNVMQKLNDYAARISLKFLYEMLEKTGQLIISTPITRNPKGDTCHRSLFWQKSIETIIEECNFDITNKTEHVWNEFPIEGGHSHQVQNICCEKIK